jgi:hypothetical protein
VVAQALPQQEEKTSREIMQNQQEQEFKNSTNCQ